MQEKRKKTVKIGGIATGVTVLICWGLTEAGVTVPAEVFGAIGSVVSAIFAETME